MRRREGTLLHSDATDPWEPGHFGQISGVDDFLDKAERLIETYDTLPKAMRAEFFGMLQRDVVKLRAYLAGDIEPRDRDALFYMMWASFHYRSLLAEIADDEKKDRRRKLTRAQYLKHQAVARNRTELALLCGMSLRALREWERNNLG